MALDKPYLDVPGTIIFDAEQSRKGYWINQFCMSLMKTEEEYRNMMISGGRSVEGNRFIGENGDAQAQNQPQGSAGKKVN